MPCAQDNWCRWSPPPTPAPPPKCSPPSVEQWLTVGQDFFFSISPERENPGNPSFHVHNIPKVVGGVAPACREQRAWPCYSQVVDRVVPVSSARTAEMTKLLETFTGR